MKIYFAPLEGITGYIFRNTFQEVYGHIDKYFAPFISPSEKSPVTAREKKDLAPENNSGIVLVPQILARRSDRFIEAAEELKAMGYREVNLNLGCPSGTVCAKGKGAGFLADTPALESFLDEIYSFSEKEGIRLSVKTRLGYADPEEFYDLVRIFNSFPISELIVHPRIRSDFYKGPIRLDSFAYAMEQVKCPLVYNGNIYTPGDYEDLSKKFGTKLDPVMIGRGQIFDPELASKLKGESPKDGQDKFRLFHDRLYHEYQKVMSPDINVLYKMKELWAFWRDMFEDQERDIKRLLKAKKYAEYDEIVYKKMFGE